ncbi:MAG TPA: hypothetical protein VLD65_02625 [Anaerolineales bacterium]|nr:hypothetical protein [Anaerolineales bacterium]
MNYIKVINKAEILLYSTLISIMSGINRYKEQGQDDPKLRQQEITAVYSYQGNVIDLESEKSVLINWDTIQQTFLSLLLWTVLGLAAGFLIGMLNHG